MVKMKTPFALKRVLILLCVLYNGDTSSIETSCGTLQCRKPSDTHISYLQTSQGVSSRCFDNGTIIHISCSRGFQHYVDHYQTTCDGETGEWQDKGSCEIELASLISVIAASVILLVFFSVAVLVLIWKSKRIREVNIDPEAAEQDPKADANVERVMFRQRNPDQLPPDGGDIEMAVFRRQDLNENPLNDAGAGVHYPQNHDQVRNHEVVEVHRPQDQDENPQNEADAGLHHPQNLDQVQNDGIAERYHQEGHDHEPDMEATLCVRKATQTEDFVNTTPRQSAATQTEIQMTDMNSWCEYHPLPLRHIDQIHIQWNHDCRSTPLSIDFGGEGSLVSMC
ncbi:uncharacterized protein LOC110978046 [Acanthaster planci]|uniref:Uncharacterized protein LOC110978046 n=1 Tax=Acanthaster planci TaxID=133434 RepID=A0A8B7Y9L1_ACAPL|nr:uncharacterized protein LOC110978046 [Acanthaster planci]XP_022088390.1 uncharacterized protein LOC110978046 [Acanthaster planci]XP_022088401.1 uncharacterized protein LOC110978046 [Acanthaster planci]